MGANFWTQGGYDSAKDAYKNTADKFTGTSGYQLASGLGGQGANAIGQSASEVAQTAAQDSGLSAGTSAAIGENAANEAAINNLESQTAEAAKANQEEVANAEKKVQEESAKAAERQQKAGNTATGALTGAATGASLGSIVPGIGTGIGALAGGLLGGLGGFFSDERTKYVSKIKDPRLLLGR